jgi:hypothetical protein
MILSSLRAVPHGSGPGEQSQVGPGKDRAAAFSLVEIMVTTGLLSLIVLGLLAMFMQTQRAFRSSMTQTDMLETGRAVSEMIARDLSEMRPAHAPYRYVGSVTNYSTNFFSEIQSLPSIWWLPSAPGVNADRTNFYQRFFFLTLANQQWGGVGYKIQEDYPNAGVGTLYRFSAWTNPANAFYLSSRFVNAPFTNCSRIADGIVHLRVKAYAQNGFPITFANNRVGAFFCTNSTIVPPGYRQVANAMALGNPFLLDQPDYYFFSNAVPAYVELELGVLESQVLQKYRAIGSANATLQRQFLTNSTAQVQIFRQRIPILNFDPSVYQ